MDMAKQLILSLDMNASPELRTEMMRTEMRTERLMKARRASKHHTTSRRAMHRKIDNHVGRPRHARESLGRAGTAHRRADRRGHLDRLGHPGLPWPARRVDEEPCRRGAGHAAALPGRPG